MDLILTPLFSPKDMPIVRAKLVANRAVPSQLIPPEHCLENVLVRVKMLLRGISIVNILST